MKENKRDLDDTKMFSDELIDTVEKKQEENNMGQLLKEFVDGKPKNINPLTEIPEPQMRLYGFSGAFKSAFFDTEEELIEYVKTHNTQYGNICVMEYLGNVADRSDVIRLTYKSGKSVLYTSVDEDGYGIYNNERSIYRGEFVWEYNHGSIREMYSAFRDRGIIFENDTYAKIDEYHKNIRAMCEERQIFTGKEKKFDEGNRKSESIEEQTFDVDGPIRKKIKSFFKKK
ncbi:MAG: hypothetical protein IJO32_06950 [Bacilli bacterium]|nr:hypothetical protein [Bacilli bacterium]